MPVHAISVTTIECDGANNATCPARATVEFAKPLSVALRLAKNAGWTIWIETTCPECSTVVSAAGHVGPAAPVMVPVDPRLYLADLTRACTDKDVTGQMPMVLVG